MSTSTAFNPPPFAAAVRPPAFIAPHQPSAPSIPSGTFVPGTKVQVGGHRVVIVKYLSEGGFAHVYLVRLPKAVDGDDEAVLKRVAVPDKESLASMRTEVETMKKLKGRHPIVTYIDSHASQLKGGGYEVFLLMEFCNGGGLIDFMNTRLQNRLTEPEVLKIFSDVAQGVACMHYLKPPLLHRDLKVENILIKTSGSTRRYKLCDFGSAAPPRPAATSAAEGRLIEDDVQKNTTLQYRSPEMIDVYRKQAIDEKSDIWALGVLLYKLCYYKTPFEEQGQMAILNASFKFPGYPSFTDQIKKLIALMLRENPQQRPNIYQVMKEISRMRGTDVPIKDIYAGRSQSEARRNQHLPSSEPEIASPPMVGAFHAPPTEEKQAIPDITPMRRGRPTKAGGGSKMPQPSPSPLRGAANDPWMVMESSSTVLAPDAVVLDDASARFPALDEFSLLHDSGSKFAFNPKSEPKKQTSRDISQRVTDYLADDAFAQPNSAHKNVTQTHHPEDQMKREERVVSSTHEQSKPKVNPSIISQQPTEQRIGYVSTGTMTSPSPPSPTTQSLSASNRPIFRFPPSPERSSSQQRVSTTVDQATTNSIIDAVGLKRPNILDHRSRSQILTLESSESSESPQRSSNRSSFLGGLDSNIHRSKSANSKPHRPTSVQAPAKPNLLRRLSRERSNSRPLDESYRETRDTPNLDLDPKQDPYPGEEVVRIDSNVDFLKLMEEEEAAKRKEKRHSSGSKHIKRSSLPSVSLSGTKNLLAGRFGDAFKRFETNTSSDDYRESSRSPIRGANDLTPIAGSEATDERSDDGMAESQEIPPEMRRELERRRLSQEERRVNDAAAAYRQRLAEGSDGGRGRSARNNNKAASIQSKVQSLLDESGKASPSPTKTAFGYGRFTDSPDQQVARPPRTSSRQAPFQPPSSGGSSYLPLRPKPQPDNTSPSADRPNGPSSTQLPPANNLPRQNAPAAERSFTRPPGGPPPKPQNKPQNLRSGDRPIPSSVKPSSLIVRKPVQGRLPHRPPPSKDLGASPNDDWETNFSKRYPDLAGLEMVETEIDSGNSITDGGSRRDMRIRDV